MKLFLWMAIIGFVIYWLRSAMSPAVHPKRTPFKAAPPAPRAIERIVQCRHCGLHVPVSEAVTGPSNAVFCSKEHQLRHFPGN